MPRFFVSKPNINGSEVTLGGDDARHIALSLRMKIGDEITVCCECVDYLCVIAAIGRHTVTAKIIYWEKCPNEPSIRLTLYQAVPKQGKLDTIIQKAVELGVYETVPVRTARSAADPVSFSKKQERYEKISLEAAKQCGRGIIPRIAPLTDFKSAIKRAAGAGECGVSDSCDNRTALIFYEGGGIRLSEMEFPVSGDVSVFIGSEGGFEQTEIDAAKALGFRVIWLGNRILRCETAPVAAISLVMYLTGNL
ncbi:MAG: 16S rRNA (uracil(1498)-N(3))-methyltransferase [Oscillospiraceae bacterium]|jgi:16S rRNA (uracil1498-N3)-methyltransferase|nr:16S rRNA (uracil(1498)-N(3))-methyltransferase [Oscillospiraceae bacterium]